MAFNYCREYVGRSVYRNICKKGEVRDKAFNTPEVEVYEKAFYIPDHVRIVWRHESEERRKVSKPPSPICAILRVGKFVGVIFKI